MNKDILICGVGGQGTILASKILAGSAMKSGNPVHTAETIGMSQRGGSVTSHIRIGDSAFSPLIPLGGADMILSFEPSEAVRCLPYLKKEGIVITNTVPTRPVTESLRPTGYDGTEMLSYLQSKCTCIPVDGAKACSEFHSMKFLNIVLLGVAAGTGRLELEKDIFLQEIENRVPERFRENNLAAFRKGFELSGSKF